MVTEQINYTKRDAAAEQKRAPDLDSHSPRSDSWLSHHVALHNKFLNSVSLPFFACKKGFHHIYFTTLLKKGKYTIATQEMVITFDSVKAVTFFFFNGSSQNHNQIQYLSWKREMRFRITGAGRQEAWALLNSRSITNTCCVSWHKALLLFGLTFLKITPSTALQFAEDG